LARETIPWFLFIVEYPDLSGTIPVLFVVQSYKNYLT